MHRHPTRAVGARTLYGGCLTHEDAAANGVVESVRHSGVSTREIVGSDSAATTAREPFLRCRQGGRGGVRRRGPEASPAPAAADPGRRLGSPSERAGELERIERVPGGDRHHRIRTGRGIAMSRRSRMSPSSAEPLSGPTGIVTGSSASSASKNVEPEPMLRRFGEQSGVPSAAAEPARRIRKGSAEAPSSHCASSM